MACPFSMMKRLFGVRRQHPHFLDDLKEIVSDTKSLQIQVTESGDIYEQLAIVSLTGSDVQYAAKIAQIIEPYMDAITDRFYQALLDNEALKTIIVANSTIEALKKTLQEHITTMLNIEIDDAFLQKRRSIALKHLHIGLQSRWYIGSFGKLHHILNEVIAREIPDEELRIQAMQVVNKLLNFEQQIVLETYEAELNRRLVAVEREKKKELHELIGATAEELAALSEQTSVSIEQVIAAIQHVSARAESGTKVMEQSYRLSEQGAGVVNALTVDMNEVMDSVADSNKEIRRLTEISHKITGIVGMVKEIATQTNLLALNASIEAARAGEHGRGFSVVAAEIRALSDQTRQAVDAISGLVNHSFAQVENVTAGMRTIDGKMDAVHRETGKTLANFRDIQRAMADMTKAGAEIAAQLANSLPIISEVGASAGRVAKLATELTMKSQRLLE